MYFTTHQFLSFFIKNRFNAFGLEEIEERFTFFSILFSWHFHKSSLYHLMAVAQETLCLHKILAGCGTMSSTFLPRKSSKSRSKPKKNLRPDILREWVRKLKNGVKLHSIKEGHLHCRRKGRKSWWNSVHQEYTA